MSTKQRRTVMDLMKFIFIIIYKRLLYYIMDWHYRAHGIYAYMFFINEKTLARTAVEAKTQPLVSVVVYSHEIFGTSLTEALKFLLLQTYEKWELLICVTPKLPIKIRLAIWLFSHQYSRDCRVPVVSGNTLAKGLGQALAVARGQYICFLNTKDRLATTTLSEMVQACQSQSVVTLVFSDEDWLPETEGSKRVPHFKPDWAPDTFRSFNYLSNFCLSRTDALRSVGAFSPDSDGAEGYDALLRLTERTPATQIIHLPKVLFQNGRKYCPSDVERAASRRVLAAHIGRMGWTGHVSNGSFPGSFRIRYGLIPSPLVSIIIPNMDHAIELEICVHSIIERTAYQRYEILIIENNSVEDQTEKCYNYFLQEYGSRISVLRWQAPFNFSALHNWAIPQARGEIILCLNNDTEVITPDWLERMLEFAQRPDVGAVGCALLYRDDTYQHAGFIFVVGLIGGHAHRYFARSDMGYWGRLKMVQNLSAVTGACMMFKKVDFLAVGGFDEDYVVAVSDVDLCLKFRAIGKVNVYVPDAELYHDEMKTRGKDDDPTKVDRFNRECEHFYAKWGRDITDPYYNANLTTKKEDFSNKYDKVAEA